MAEGRDRVEICVIHALFGCEIECALTEIRSFLDGHPDEVVVLDFQHVYCFDDGDSCRVVGMAREMFEGRLCPVKPKVTLDYMRRRGYQVHYW